MRPARSLPYRAYRHVHGRVNIASAELRPHELIDKHGHFVLVEPTFVGICSADIREVRGERPGRCDFGHEVVGTVLESTHPLYSAGDPVVLNPFAKVCRETAFAEVMYLAGPHDSLATALVKVPSDGIQFSTVEPLACAIHAARQSLTDGSEPKLVLGAGFFGYLIYRYLEFTNVPVTLANRTNDRLADLRKRTGSVTVADDLAQCAATFSTVFLMQARISRGDVASAARLVRDYGEIVLFGAFDRNEDEVLYTTRNMQLRTLNTHECKHYYLQGTLDASPSDLEEAIRMLSYPEFVRNVAAIYARPLTFQQGAAHLTERALSPRSYQKYVVGMKINEEFHDNAQLP